MPAFSIRNPYFILVSALILLILGVGAIVRMPVDLFPRLDLPVVVIATFFPGMPPEQVEKNITKGMMMIIMMKITKTIIIRFFDIPRNSN